MLSKVDEFLLNIEKKEKVIKYLKTIYRVEVGEEAVVPDAYIEGGMRLETFNTEEGGASSSELETQFSTFKEKINSLKLPEINDKDIKAKIAKMRKEKSPLLLKEINISNYGDKGITQELFMKLLDGMRILKSVEMINLKNNKLDDSYIDFVCELLNIEGLKRIDISFNNFQKNAARKLYTTIKTGKALEYFDCSFNPFCSDEFSVTQVTFSLKSHPNIFHIGISDCTRDSVLKVIPYLPNLRSLNLDDCRYKAKSLEQLFKQLTDKKYSNSIAELSMRYLPIDTINSGIFEKIVRLNKTLVHLNLYGCNLSDCAGSRIIKEIENNKTLVSLNLGFNNLGDEFCASFGQKIDHNYTLSTINITKNYLICNKNFYHIVESLVNNQTLTSLGDLTDTKVGVKLRESAELILGINKKFLYNEILLDFSKTEKQNFLRLSMEGVEKVADEININKNERERDIKDQVKVESLEDQINRVISKYEINLKEDELDDFQFFNTQLLL